MNKFMDKFLGRPKFLEEAKGSKSHSLIIEMLIFLLILFIAERAQSIPVTIGTVIWMFTGNFFSSMGSAFIFDSEALTAAMPDWLMILSLFATACSTLVIIVYCTKIEKRPLSSMGFRKGSFGKEYVIGAALGILMITAAVVIGMLTGAYKLTPAGLLKPAAASLIFWLLGYLLQGMNEEVITRGYLMTSLSRKIPLHGAILISSMVFALMHLSNPGISFLAILNILLCGAVFAVYIVKRGSIWGACAMHSFWNFYQGCVYGVSVSGTGSCDCTLFNAVPAENMDLWTGGDFGIEGGLAVTIVMVIMLLIVLFLVPKAKDEQVENIEEGKTEGIIPETVPEEVMPEEIKDAGLTAAVSEEIRAEAAETVPEEIRAETAQTVPEGIRAETAQTVPEGIRAETAQTVPEEIRAETVSRTEPVPAVEAPVNDPATDEMKTAAPAAEVQPEAPVGNPPVA